MSGRLDEMEKRANDTINVRAFYEETWYDLATDVLLLVEVAKAAREFHETFWNPWRTGRSDAMTSDSVADAYGALRAALARLDATTTEAKT